MHGKPEMFDEMTSSTQSRLPVFFCKSLTEDGEAIGKRLLEKRWDMIQTNIPREELKIRNLKLYHIDMEVPLETWPSISSISIILLNICSIISLDKRLDCIKLLSIYLSDLLCLCATWLDSDDSNILPSSGYTVVSQGSRKQSQHGCVAILVKNSIRVTVIYSTNYLYDFSCACVLISDPINSVINIYNPPVSSFYRIPLSTLKNCLLGYTFNFLAKHPLVCIVVCGDFNLSDVCWVSYHGASNYSNDNLDFFAHFNKIHFIESPSYVSQKKLDLCLS